MDESLILDRDENPLKAAAANQIAKDELTSQNSHRSLGRRSNAGSKMGRMTSGGRPRNQVFPVNFQQVVAEMRKMLSKEYEKNPSNLTSFIHKDMDRGLFLKYIAVAQDKPSEPTSP